MITRLDAAGALPVGRRCVALSGLARVWKGSGGCSFRGLAVYGMRRILWPEMLVLLLSLLEGALWMSNSKAASSANLASRIEVPAGKEGLAMLWLWRSRGRDVMLDAWVRRWMCSVACVAGKLGEAMAM